MVVSSPTPSKVTAAAKTPPAEASTTAPATETAIAAQPAFQSVTPETTAPHVINSPDQSHGGQQQSDGQNPSYDPGQNSNYNPDDRSSIHGVDQDTDHGAQPRSEQHSRRARTFRGMGKFPPRLSREPRPQNSPYAKVNLPPLPLHNYGSIGSRPIPPLNTAAFFQEPRNVNAEVVTLEMRPARLQVSNLWHRLRFSRFSPMASQRRRWKPGKPRRGRPEGTKGAGSRSL